MQMPGLVFLLAFMTVQTFPGKIHEYNSGEACYQYFSYEYEKQKGKFMFNCKTCVLLSLFDGSHISQYKTKFSFKFCTFLVEVLFFRS